MKLRHLLSAFLSVSLVLSAATVWLAGELQGALERVAGAETRRFKSISLADELRQSSDDLTRFARMYVQTGDERFAEYFDRVLTIRNGERPRPDQYAGVYWDLVVNNPALLDESVGEATSLQERMKLLGFSEVEFGLLALAQKRSDALTMIENRAFNAMRGRFDDGTGRYTVVREPDRALAQSLLYGQAYHLAKALIMEPIGRFQQRVNARTAAALDAVRKDADALLLGTFASAGSLLALLAVFAFLVHRRVVRRVGALEGAAEQITAGDLDARSQVRGSDELGTLGTTFDEMVSRLAETLEVVTAAKDRMEEELNVGRDIQMSMVPLTFPAFPDRDELSIYATLKPAREVGGDFYDFFFIDENHLGFCVGDVSGKGVPAALFMAVSRTLIRAHATNDASPAAVLTRVNEELSADNPSCMFVTLFMGVLDVRTGECVYTNAGHNPPYHLRGGEVATLEGRHGPILGAMDGLTYTESRIRLLVGDTLIIFTDGVTEAMSPEDELLGEARLEEQLRRDGAVAPEKLIDNVVTLVKTFEAGTEQSDDVTVLALRLDQLATRRSAHQTVVFKNQLEELDRVMKAVDGFCRQHDVDSALKGKLNVVLDDLVANVVSYAYDDNEEHAIELTLELGTERFTVRVSDDGKPFDPLATERSDTTLSLKEREIGGLGIELIRGLSDTVVYERKGARNVLSVSFNLPARGEERPS